MLLIREHEIEIIKVAAHTDIAQAEDKLGKWNLLGNEAADEAAKDSMSHSFKQLRTAVDTNEAASTLSLNILGRVACVRMKQALPNISQAKSLSKKEKFPALQGGGDPGARIRQKAQGKSSGRPCGLVLK